MISILIPVYNADVVSLINELSRQLRTIDMDGEIIVFDDASTSVFKEINRKGAVVDHVIYRELDRNHGRTAIRKLLASEARFEWLLFLDSDSGILSPDFLRQYISRLESGYDVLIGGRLYPQKPGPCDRRLHWKYGVERESVKGNQTRLHTNNFCIRKETFFQLNFPEFLNAYGHEDTWMEMELNGLNKKMQHIHNPVEHLQIEETGTFLNKTRQALNNLLLLEKTTDKGRLKKQVSLFKSYETVRQLHLAFAVRFFYSSFKKKIADNLSSCNPSLLVFDFYRLYHFLQLHRRDV